MVYPPLVLDRLSRCLALVCSSGQGPHYEYELRL
jgi:hypothetical protein